MDINKKFSLSLVIPVFNEEQSLKILFEEINKSMDSLKNCMSYELIFVDDGSTDGTGKLLNSGKAESERIKVLTLKKNVGNSCS